MLAFSFSFSNTLKQLLEAIIYLFVVHPFDVGDGIFVGTGGSDYYKVKQQSGCRLSRDCGGAGVMLGAVVRSGFGPLGNRGSNRVVWFGVRGRV